jgi:hypothetical protein
LIAPQVRIKFQDVLELPKEKQEELAELLDQTSLSAIIESSKLVADRLTFLKGLEELLLNKESKKELDERSQFHKILEEETWIFGEEFHLTTSDETLTILIKSANRKAIDDWQIADEEFDETVDRSAFTMSDDPPELFTDLD